MRSFEETVTRERHADSAADALRGKPEGGRDRDDDMPALPGRGRGTRPLRRAPVMGLPTLRREGHGLSAGYDAADRGAWGFPGQPRRHAAGGARVARDGARSLAGSARLQPRHLEGGAGAAFACLRRAGGGRGKARIGYCHSRAS